jgi:hypothetical protein
VRKALGGHEIATVQMTAIDKEAGVIRLTTTLAHSSGEWLSSEWPVCAVSETVAPRRMGAALTYARRYSLFNLVGIAGEDDLDAPGLGAGVNSDRRLGLDIQTSTTPATDEPSFALPGASRKGKVIRAPRIVLATDQSEALRDRLVAEFSDLKSADEAADWVHKNLAAKNTLAAADAETLEASFRERLETIEGGQPGSRISEAVGASSAEHPQEQSQALGDPETPAPDREGGPTPPPCSEDHSFARQGALQIRRHATMRRLRPHAHRSASHSLRPTPGARPQGQRRIHGPSLPSPSSRPPWLWR